MSADFLALAGFVIGFLAGGFFTSLCRSPRDEYVGGQYAGILRELTGLRHDLLWKTSEREMKQQVKDAAA